MGLFFKTQARDGANRVFNNRALVKTIFEALKRL